MVGEDCYRKAGGGNGGLNCVLRGRNGSPSSPWAKNKRLGISSIEEGGGALLACLGEELPSSFCRQGKEATLSIAAASAAYELSGCQLESAGKRPALAVHAAEYVHKAPLTER